MLLAKIRDVLLNRRNKVEIESLEGEVTVNGKPLSDNFSSIYEVQNIKAISEEILSKLKAGDVVQKVDSSGKHSYIVSFKKDGIGICLTYTDASIVETQSYDFTEGHWVYNSEDLSSVGGTKLYRHNITFTLGDVLVIICNNPNDFANFTDIMQGFQQMFCGFMKSNTYTQGNVLWIDPQQVTYYDTDEGVNQIDGLVIETDTVTPL